MCLAPIHPLISVYHLKGGQRGYRGHVINFRQDISTFVSKLPIHPRNLPCTILLNKKTADGYIDLKIDGCRVRRVLIWLIANNIYFRYFTID